MAVIYVNNMFDELDGWQARRESLDFVLFMLSETGWNFHCNESVLIIF